jgi:hypothetical protein
MIGTAIGPYRIESELGSGGRGRVWLAEAVELCVVPAGTRVTLKVVHPTSSPSPASSSDSSAKRGWGRRSSIRTWSGPSIAAPWAATTSS